MSKFTALPSTKLGWLGLGATVLFVALFLVKSSVGLPIPTFGIFGIGFGAIAINITAWIQKERSILLLVVGGLVGFATIIWTLAEVLMPH